MKHIKTQRKNINLQLSEMISVLSYIKITKLNFGGNNEKENRKRQDVF
jgi:hypothetical protein